eukprot:PITA_21870
MDILDGLSVLEFETDIVDDPMEPMDPLDSPLSNPPTTKRPLGSVTLFSLLIVMCSSKDRLEKGGSHADICYVVNTLSQFLTKPLHANWTAAKHILRYSQGTITLGLRYSTGDVRLHGYTDADWERNFIDMKSTSGCCFSLGSAMISWMSKKHKYVALSTVEAKYIAASMTICESVWLRKLFGDLFEQVLDTTTIYCVNKSGIHLAENLIFHEKSKYIEI